jgi:hypothetical protein
MNVKKSRANHITKVTTTRYESERVVIELTHYTEDEMPFWPWW